MNSNKRTIVLAILSIYGSLKFSKSFSYSTDYNEIEKHLKFKKILKVEPWSKKDNVYLVTLEGGLKAIFKNKFLLASLGEVACYNISRNLGNTLVPPTVLRNIESKTGSLQLYIDSNFFKLSKSKRKELFDTLPNKTISEALIFSFIFNRSDWHKSGNIIIKNNKLFLIDNELTALIAKGSYGTYPFIRVGYCSKINLNFNQDFNLKKATFLKNIPLTVLSNFKSFGGGTLLHLKKKYNKSLCVFTKNSFFWQIPNDRILNFTNIYFKSTIETYEKLNKKLLEKAWNIHPYYSKHRNYFNEMFEDIMDRKNQILNNSKKTRTID